MQVIAAGDCSAIGIPTATTASPVLGPNLGEICRDKSADPPPDLVPGAPPPPSVSGGGAGAVQLSGSAAAQSDAVKRRLERAKEEQAGQARQLASLAQSDDSYRVFDLERVGVFLSADFDRLDREETTFEAGYDSSAWGITGGGDYRFSESLVAGAAFNFSRLNGDFIGQGRFDTDSYGAIGYVSVSSGDAFFADVVAGYARKRFEVERVITGVFNGVTVLDGVTASDTHGDEFSASVLVGRDFPIERFTVGPRAGVNYVVTRIDGVAETGSSGLQLVYDDRTESSLQSVLGVQATAAFSTGFGVMVPQMNVEWVHEFQDDQQSIDVRFAEDLRPDPVKFTFQTEKPDRDFFNLSLGLVALLPGGVQPFVEVRTILGHAFIDGYGGSIGVRFAL